MLAAPNRNLCHPEQRDAILEFKNEFEIQKPCVLMGLLRRSRGRITAIVVLGMVSNAMPSLECDRAEP